MRIFILFSLIGYEFLSLQDDDDENGGHNTSDEEFERQLEEAALIQEQEKVEKAKRPKMKKGRGRNARKRSKKPTGDGEGEEVSGGQEVNQGLIWSFVFTADRPPGLLRGVPTGRRDHSVRHLPPRLPLGLLGA